MTHPYYLCTPASFRPGEFLRTLRLCTLGDDARYLVHLVLTKLARRNVDRRGYVRLMAEHLRAIMHHRDYRAVIDALLEGGALTTSPYLAGARATGYRLADRYLGDAHVRTPVTCRRLGQRLRKYHERAEAQRRAAMSPVHLELERRQTALRIDGGLAREILSGLPPGTNPWDVQGMQIAHIERGEYRLAVGRYGRISNSITNLKREIRTALRVEGQPLAHVDLSCSQPALVALVAEQRNAHTNSTDERTDGNTKRQSIYAAPANPPVGGDWGLYRSLAEDGTLYEYLVDRLKTRTCPGLDRGQVKKRFLTDVLAKRKANRHGAEYPSPVEDLFQELFPSVHRFIRACNCNGWKHADLIRELQRTESQLVIETVAADLMDRHRNLCVLTLHDAIFTTPDEIPLVVEGFERAFEAMGFRLALKVSA